MKDKGSNKDAGEASEETRIEKKRLIKDNIL
jgi:hypothetical protein